MRYHAKAREVMVFLSQESVCQEGNFDGKKTKPVIRGILNPKKRKLKKMMQISKDGR